MMNKRPYSYIIICLIGFLILIFGSACTGSSEQKVEHQPNAPEIPENISPGTVLTEVSIMKVEQKDDDILCQVVVNKVLKYGPTTKPIGDGTVLDLQVSVKDETLKKQVFESKKTDIFIFKLYQQQQLGISSSSESWKAAVISKK